MIRLAFVLLLVGPAGALALSPPQAPKPVVEVLLDHPSTKVVQITLAPGAPLPTHTTPVDATVVALSGSGTVVIGDKKVPLARHATVFLPKRVPHAVLNTGAGPLVLLVHHLKAAPAK